MLNQFSSKPIPKYPFQIGFDNALAPNRRQAFIWKIMVCDVNVR